MTMKNAAVAEAFVKGAIHGRSGNLHIVDDRLYSYGKCIAIRVQERSDWFIISNHAANLGGSSVSQSTSAHIGHIYRACCDAGKPIKLVVGWAESDKPVWYIPAPYKTEAGIIRGFGMGVWDGWVGDWNKEIGTRRVVMEIKGNQLIADGILLATRHYVGHDHIWKGNYDEFCEICPHRFKCLTDRFVIVECPYYAFSIADTRYKDLIWQTLVKIPAAIEPTPIIQMST